MLRFPVTQGVEWFQSESAYCLRQPTFHFCLGKLSAAFKFKWYDLIEDFILVQGVINVNPLHRFLIFISSTNSITLLYQRSCLNSTYKFSKSGKAKQLRLRYWSDKRSVGVALEMLHFPVTQGVKWFQSESVYCLRPPTSQKSFQQPSNLNGMI